MEQLQERMDNMHSRESTLRANQKSLTQFIEDLKILNDNKDKNLSVCIVYLNYFFQLSRMLEGAKTGNSVRGGCKDSIFRKTEHGENSLKYTISYNFHQVCETFFTFAKDWKSAQN